MPSQDFLGIAGAIMSFVGLVFVGIQIRRTAKTSRGEFFLHLDEMFYEFEEVIIALKEPDWKPSSKFGRERDVVSKVHSEIADNLNTIKIGHYMGLFERIYFLITSNILDYKSFEDFYSYKLRDVILNDYVYNDRLIKTPYGWINLIRLANHLALKKKSQLNPTRISEKSIKDWESFIERSENLKSKIAPEFFNQDENYSTYNR